MANAVDVMSAPLHRYPPCASHFVYGSVTLMDMVGTAGEFESGGASKVASAGWRLDSDRAKSALDRAKSEPRTGLAWWRTSTIHQYKRPELRQPQLNGLLHFSC